MLKEFADFLAHVAAGKILMQRWRSDDEFPRANWQTHQIHYLHPERLKHVIRASFEELKETQRRILIGQLKSVDEEELEERIQNRVETLNDEWNSKEPSFVSQMRAGKRPIA